MHSMSLSPLNMKTQCAHTRIESAYEPCLAPPVGSCKARLSS